MTESDAEGNNAGGQPLPQNNSEPRQAEENIDSSAMPIADSSIALILQLERLWPRASTIRQRGDVRIGNYLVEDELGRGGFGIVFRVRSPEGRVVALKLPRLELLEEPELCQRFLREAEAMVSLQHEHIVSVLEVGTVEDMHYIVSEYCPEGSLERWLLNQPALTFRQAAKFVHKLAVATHYIHEQGILHRDLKPSNVLLRRLDDAPTGADDLPFIPLLTDFGLAKLVQQSVEETRSSLMIGTPLYMAPEQAACRQDEVGPATDVYSLGVILYELLVGRPPFIGPGLLSVLNEVQQKAPVPPRQFFSNIPSTLERICLKCLSKEPGDRYATAADLAADLAAFQTGKRVAARPPGALVQFSRWTTNPQRIIDAGVWGTLLNGCVFVWLAYEIPYVLLAPDLNFDRKAVVFDAILMGSTFTVPQVLAGIFTLRGSRWALWIGFIFAVANWFISLAGQFHLVHLFGNLYDATPGLRVLMFGLLSTLIFSVMFLYAAAVRADTFRRIRDSL